jgi:uncharacterized protein (TIGR02118 family)
MNTVCEVAIAASGSSSGPVERAPQAMELWAGLPELVSFDLYTPATAQAEDPYVQDGPAPAWLAMLAFPSLEALERATGDKRFMAILAGLGKRVLTCTAMQRSDYPVAGTDAPAPLHAPFSYMVRYHRPADDEALFVRHYIETHPALLARLPAIRNVMCYLPLAWKHAAGVPPADYMLGNEVVFDHIDHFNEAMASPLRHQLRAHFRQFPIFSGRNTHYPMARRRIAG